MCYKMGKKPETNFFIQFKWVEGINFLKGRKLCEEYQRMKW